MNPQAQQAAEPPTDRASSARPHRTPVGPVPHGDSALRRAGRSALRLVTSTAAVRELVELAAAVQAPVTTGRRIAVVSVRGGAGRSTVTALLGTVCALRRADNVLVAGADTDAGSLASRLGLPEPAPLGVLAPRLLAACAAGLDDVDALLSRTPAGLRLLPGASPEHPRPTRDVLRALSRFFAVAVAVADCGRGLLQPATLDVVAESHAVVVVVPATPDGLRSTCAGLDRLLAGAPAGVVLCTVDRTGLAAIATPAGRAALDRFGVPVVWLPYDRHLAAGGPIVPGRLGEAAVVAATRLAGHALDRANRG